MKKFIALLLAAVMCLSLTACGLKHKSSVAVAGPAFNDTNAGSDSAADKVVSEFNDAVRNLSEAKDSLSEIITESEELLEAMGNDESEISMLKLKLEEAKTALSVFVPEIVTDAEKNSEQTQNLNLEVDNLWRIYEELEQIAASTKEKYQAAIALNDGIIVVDVSYGDFYTYKSTGTFKFMAFTADLNKIDPETGNVTHIRTFSSENTHSCSAYLSDIGGYTEYALRNFNSDMTLMTATITLESGANHIGWIDENGQFTDVSAIITTESDFGALTNHAKPRFFGDYLYFRDFTNTSAQVKRVPLNNLTADAVEIMIDDTYWNYDIHPNLDGTVLDTYDGYEYYDSSMQYPARAGDIYDWVSADTCIGNGNGANDPYVIYKYQLSGEEDVFHWYSDRTTFIPSVKDRINWNAVVSPESNQVAFLSKLETGTDQSPSLFIISIDGGDPVKVQTNLFFGENTSLIDWR